MLAGRLNEFSVFLHFVKFPQKKTPLRSSPLRRYIFGETKSRPGAHCYSRDVAAVEICATKRRPFGKMKFTGWPELDPFKCISEVLFALRSILAVRAKFSHICRVPPMGANFKIYRWRANLQFFCVFDLSRTNPPSCNWLISSLRAARQFQLLRSPSDFFHWPKRRWRWTFFGAEKRP